MIITLFGGADRSHEAWAARLPRPFRVTTFKDGDLKFPGPHDAQILAVFFRRMRGVPGAEGKRDTMPVWDLFENGSLTGRPLRADELAETSHDLQATIGRLWANRTTYAHLAVVIDPVEDWWNMLVTKSIDASGDVVVSKALREQRATQTLYWLSRSLPVVLTASERPRVVAGQVVGYEPNIEPAIANVSDLILDVRDGKAKVYATRPHVRVNNTPLTVGANVEPAAFESLLGLLSEPNLEDTDA